MTTLPRWYVLVVVMLSLSVLVFAFAVLTFFAVQAWSWVAS